MAEAKIATIKVTERKAMSGVESQSQKEDSHFSFAFIFFSIDVQYDWSHTQRFMAVHGNVKSYHELSRKMKGS